MFSFAASFGPDFTITFRPLELSIETSFILLTFATMLPGLYCVCAYPESRSSLRKLNASWKLYLAAIATGLILPFTSYFGTRHPEFPWGREALAQLGRVFALNLFLAPFWEEIVWRGCFLNKVRSLYPASGGILLMSVGWTLWHGGYIAYLYSKGMPANVLYIYTPTVFCIGILLGSVFELGRASLWPCVLLHTSFNAATAVYYSEYGRASELGSYVSELVFVAIAAAVFSRSHFDAAANRSLHPGFPGSDLDGGLESGSWGHW
ncbi:MAG TPA: CPBP family intramembrane glutamic endopeptidase [Terracidiphilus sp.]|nr:CPBP family intramembrane glutamic endopeptidase [Terracidiphilus sp.]